MGLCSLPFDLRPNYGGGNEDNGNLLQRFHAGIATLNAPDPAAGQHQPTPPLETHGRSQASLGQSLVGFLLLSPGSWWAQQISQSGDLPKGLRIPWEFEFGGHCDLITELTQDWGNRLLEGTNNSLCAPGRRSTKYSSILNGTCKMVICYSVLFANVLLRI